MRVLAVAFPERGAAVRALDALRARYELGPADAGVAPLGSDTADPARTVFAGRFHDDVVPDVRRYVTELGGEVVSDVDERWTRSPVAQESIEG
jgi:hypothetical protein